MYRRNIDEKLRSAYRQDPRSAQSLKIRLRTGDLSYESLQFAAFLEDSEALKLVKGEIFDNLLLEDFPEWFSDFGYYMQYLLNENGISTIGDLIQLTSQDLLKFRNFGLRRLRFIKRILAQIGLALKDDLLEKSFKIEDKIDYLVKDRFNFFYVLDFIFYYIELLIEQQLPYTTERTNFFELTKLVIEELRIQKGFRISATEYHESINDAIFLLDDHAGIDIFSVAIRRLTYYPLEHEIIFDLLCKASSLIFASQPIAIEHRREALVSWLLK